MKQIMISGFILALVFACITGCDDDEPEANVIHLFRSYTITAYADFACFDMNLYMTLEETEGIGVQLCSITFHVVLTGKETDASTPADLHCPEIEEIYNLPACYLPGDHKTEESLVSFSVTPFTSEDLKTIEILASLIGTDDNGNRIEVVSKIQMSI